MEDDPDDPVEAIESSLALLRAADPSAALMARMVAVRPGRRARHGTNGTASAPSSAPRRSWPLAWIAATSGIAAALAVALVVSAPPVAGPALTGSPATGNAPADPAFSDPAPQSGDQVFLPVAKRVRLLDVGPAFLIQRPDQAPQRVAKAVWVEELTAVGAEADETLRLTRTGSGLIPVSIPVY